jgi:hypothetical protein
MRLILTTPAPQGPSVLRYANWREVIAEYVSERTGTRPDDLLPQLLDTTMSHLLSYISA